MTGTTLPLTKAYLVDFGSDELLTADVAGQYVRGSDGNLRDFKVSVQKSAFTMFCLNLRLPGTAGNPPNRFVDIVVTAFGGKLRLTA